MQKTKLERKNLLDALLWKSSRKICMQLLVLAWNMFFCFMTSFLLLHLLISYLVKFIINITIFNFFLTCHLQMCSISPLTCPRSYIPVLGAYLFQSTSTILICLSFAFLCLVLLCKYFAFFTWYTSIRWKKEWASVLEDTYQVQVNRSHYSWKELSELNNQERSVRTAK